MLSSIEWLPDDACVEIGEDLRCRSSMMSSLQLAEQLLTLHYRVIACMVDAQMWQGFLTNSSKRQLTKSSLRHEGGGRRKRRKGGEEEEVS